MTDITWHEATRKLSELKSYVKNPRKVTKYAFESLVRNIEALGYHSRIKCNIDGTIAGGHARLKALKKLGYKEIAVLLPSRPLTEEEFKRCLITDNINAGSFDMDIIANDFEVDDLNEWGFDETPLPDLNTPVLEEETEETEEKLCKKCPYKEKE
jgi:ParB-like chromosome segregation protein Spo0J